MKYTISTTIHKPINQVIALFDDPANLKHSFPTLQSTELIGGVAGQPGAKTRMNFKNGNRTLTLTETVLVRNYPHEFTCAYEAPNVYNTVKNSFSKAGENATLYTSEQEFKLKGFVKVLGWIMPGAFKKEGIKHMNLFKEFAEKQ
ncbi:MAG: SRPBCC family protein [Bacteroidia bacterium]|jgi:hypothetical protein|nr:SRPBCC family protein [Bacteroidia bacterium]